METENNLKLLLVLSAVMLFGCKNELKKTETVENDPQISIEKESEWQVLFNGENFDGWMSTNNKTPEENGLKIEDGELVMSPAEGKNQWDGDIITEKKYSDFEFQWDWKMNTKGGNSGIKYYVNSPDGKGFPGIEYQLLDDENFSWMLEGKMKPNDYRTLGAPYELYEPDSSKSPSPLGEWNTSKIVSQDGKVQHWLNGKKIAEFDRFSTDFDERVAESKFKDIIDFGKQADGHIMIQEHGGSIHFKKIKIKEL